MELIGDLDRASFTATRLGWTQGRMGEELEQSGQLFLCKFFFFFVKGTTDGGWSGMWSQRQFLFLLFLFV